MRVITPIAGLLVMGAIALVLLRDDMPGRANSLDGSAPISGSVAEQPSVRGVRPVGVNLGLWTYWGAEQLSSNVIKNPGFEGMVDRAIVVVHSAEGRRFSDDQSWTGRSDGFWKNATAEVRTGNSAGRQSQIVDSLRSGRLGLPQFEVADDLPLAPGDVIALTRIDDRSPPANWWIPAESSSAIEVVGERRPGSSGVRSLSLRTRQDRPTEIISYLDTITDRAGKMLPVRGKWRMSFWAAARNGGGTLRVRFFRQGEYAFLDQAVSPGPAWRRESFEFTSEDRGPALPLELHFQASGGGGEILLDDVELRSAEDDSAFRRQVLDTLSRLHPGLLRDWQGQLGDTFENRVADEFGRRTSRYRAGTPGESDYLYSAADFLDLCRRVGADPWVVAPVTFGDAEWENFGRFLGAQYRRGGFSEILVEFGNENWNPLFRYAAVPDPQAHGQAARRAAQKMREGAGADVPLHFVVNAQHANPTLSARIAAEAPAGAMVAIAPYFFPALARGTQASNAWRAMFAGDSGRLGEIVTAASAAGKETAVYEVNLNTLDGDAPQSERDPAVVSRVAASALARTLLASYAHGVRRQCVWGLSGFDVYLSPVAGRTRLFGLVRDFGDTGRLRPSGLAVELLNRAVQGDYHAVTGIASQSRVSAYAFRSAAGWSVVVVSSSPQSQDVAIRIPGSDFPPLPGHLYAITSDAPDSTNEDAEDVRIVEETVRVAGRVVTVTVPPWGLAAAIPQRIPGAKGATP